MYQMRPALSESVPAQASSQLLTTLATATDTSREVALIAGASAVMAVTPQIEVPAAMRWPMRGGSPILLANQGMNSSPEPTDTHTSGTLHSTAITTVEELDGKRGLLCRCMSRQIKGREKEVRAIQSVS